MRTGSAAAAGLRRTCNLPLPCVIQANSWSVEIHIGSSRQAPWLRLDNSRIPRSRERPGPIHRLTVNISRAYPLSKSRVLHIFRIIFTRGPGLYRLSLIQAVSRRGSGNIYYPWETCCEATCPAKLLFRRCAFSDYFRYSRLSSLCTSSSIWFPIEFASFINENSWFALWIWETSFTYFRVSFDFLISFTEDK